jgi:8-hydroxy-5-deazaflavin:NADPH oxidoreductase
VNIAMIGTGNVGKALGTSFVRAGHQVTFAARDADKTRAVAAELGARAADSAAEAARDADVVVLAVWYSSEEEVAADIAPVSAGKVVIDVANPLTPDYSGLATAGGPSAAERLAERLPNAKVAKAFNTLFATVQADPTAHGTRLDGLYAADDEDARATVAALLDSIGLRPVNVGALERARELEALGFLNIGLQTAHGGDWRSAFVIRGAPAGATTAPASARA